MLLNVVCWILRTGTLWRHLPPETVAERTPIPDKALCSLSYHFPLFKPTHWLTDSKSCSRSNLLR